MNSKIALADRMLAMLREIEWTVDGCCNSGNESFCGSCGAEERDGHHENCELAALLREAVEDKP